MNDWLKTLSQAKKKRTRIVAGIMSGTSVDAVDVALCKISGCGLSGRDGKGATVELIALHSHPYPAALQSRIRACKEAGVREVAELHVAVGELFAAALQEASTRYDVPLSTIDVVGSHGQTVYHHSRVVDAARVTLQIGDADVIAERTGNAVFFDFRARDIAAGGEGAPLTPYADLALFLPKLPALSKAVVLNLGGIGNMTVLSDPDCMLGFDTGPANAPLDRVVRIITKGSELHDVGGAIARSGTVIQPLLDELLQQDLYVRAQPPKSTGFEMYGDAWVDALVAKANGASANLLTTVTEFVARTIGFSLEQFVTPTFPVSTLIVAGGGYNNGYLMERIAEAVAPVQVVSSDSLGVPGQAREAMAFAILANDALCGIATSLPVVTGCKSPVILGKLALPIERNP